MASWLLVVVARLLEVCGVRGRSKFARMTRDDRLLVMELLSSGLRLEEAGGRWDAPGVRWGGCWWRWGGEGRTRPRSPLRLSLDGARGDPGRDRGRRVVSRDRPADRAGAVDGQPRGRRQWRPRALPGVARRRRGVRRGAAAQAGQAGLQPAAAAGGGGDARASAGRRSRSRPGCGSSIPDDPEMRVSPRDDLPVAVRPGRGALRKELARCLRSGRARAPPAGPRPDRPGPDPGHGHRSASGPPRSKTGRCPATGKAT